MYSIRTSSAPLNEYPTLHLRNYSDTMEVLGSIFMDDKQAKRLGKLLRDRRAALGLTVRQVEARSGIPFPTITRLEQGAFSAPAPDKLARLAEALGLSLADIYALADYAVPADLPSPTLYLRAKFRDLPPKQLAAVSRDVERAFKAHGIDPNAGPVPGEGEQPEPPRTRTRSAPKKQKRGGKKK